MEDTLFKRYNIISIILVAIVLIICSFNCYAYHNLYGECVKGYEFTDNKIDAIVLSPVNRMCQARCQKECSAFSRKIYADDQDPESPGGELNDDIITNCMSICQDGKIFESRYFEVKKRTKKGDPIQIELKPAVKIGVACSGTKDEIGNNMVRTSFTVDKKSQIKISLTGLTADSSKIYMCGKKSITLNPIFPNLSAANFDINNSNWSDDTSKQTIWSTKMDHQCFANMSDSDFNALTNKKIWANRMGTTVCDWHAKNPNYINTEIYVANNDELNISWVGEYAYKYKSNDTTLATRKELIDCLRSNSTTPAAKVNCKNIFLHSSSIELKDPNQSSFDFTSSGTAINYVIQGEKARPDHAPIGTFNAALPENAYKIFNLTGRVTDEGLESEFNTGVSGCDEKDQNSFSKPECIMIKQYGRSKYIFSGILKDFSNKRTPLGIRYHDEVQFSGSMSSNDYANLYKNNHFGGYNVTIKWGGCPFSDGSNIQYAVFEEAKEISSMYDDLPKIPESNWKDLPLDVLKPDGVLKFPELSQDNNADKKDKNGRLFLRIKKLTLTAGSDPVIQDLYENPANHHGQYYITVEQLDDSSLVVKNGPIVKLIKIVTDTLLGKRRNIGEVTSGGVIYKIYHSLASNPKLITMVKTTLVLYIAFVGIGFSIGVIKANKQELIYRILKFGFVLAVVSPNSWEIFGGYLVPLCIDGTTEIIASIMAGSYSLETAGLTQNEIIQNPYLIFETFDGPLKIMLSSAVWKKIVAILFNGLIGVVITIIIIIAILIYLINILKVLVVYLVAIIVLSLLIIMAPVILPFILFAQTKSIFDQWAKQIISFMLQPIMCFAAVSLFNFLLVMLLKIMLNFTACPSCALYIDLSPIYSACWIPSYYPIFSVHMPTQESGSFGVLFGIVSTALAFLIIVHGSYVFTTYMSLIASTIVTGAPIRTASVMGAVEKAQDVAVGTAKVITYNASNYMMSKVHRSRVGESSNIDEKAADDKKDNEVQNSNNSNTKR